MIKKSMKLKQDDKMYSDNNSIRNSTERIQYNLLRAIDDKNNSNVDNEHTSNSNSSRWNLRHNLSTIFVKQLPFQLTKCQRRAIDEIDCAMESSSKMERLLQGDVGSGKTVVALSALLNAVGNGKIGVLLVPTEILAKQHYQFINENLQAINKLLPENSGTANRNDDNSCGRSDASVNSIVDKDFEARLANRGDRQREGYPKVEINKSGDFCHRLPLTVELLTAAVKGKSRDQLLSRIEAGQVGIIVGTHALLSENVLEAIRSSIGLAVIDEEQRFGVDQRSLLSSLCHTLYMTATPIPRSLMHVSYVVLYIVYSYG